ncbi:MAG: hypothetical protein WCY06_08295 [Flavobacteriaceae bacterium]
MFLGLIKKLSLKKLVKKNLAKTNAPSEGKIEHVGLLIDGTKFNKTKQLTKEFIKSGIDPKQIKVLVYTKNKTLKDTENIVYFRSKNITFSGKISNEKVKKFTDYSFDLLVNYYNEQQTDLIYLSLKSKASFRAGFVLEEKRLNHFMIDVPLSNYQLFTEELFKYLKVLNKT